jgi:retron-type reverse transcriptase
MERGLGKIMFEFERATSMDALHNAWQKVSGKNGCAGNDGVDLSFYRSDLRNNLRALQTAVVNADYCPYVEKRYNHKDRLISIHCVDDKIVQTAVAQVVMSAYEPSKCVHGFVSGRSIFTAKKSLDGAVRGGIVGYVKVDIKRFYDSIDNELLVRKLRSLFRVGKFLSLAVTLVNAHRPGISTGSCLSPALSNLYLADFDGELERRSEFYARYVDDMLIAPAENIALTAERLAEVGLEVNTDKSKPVNATDGFTFLGFDIKAAVDAAILEGDFGRRGAIRRRSGAKRHLRGRKWRHKQRSWFGSWKFRATAGAAKTAGAADAAGAATTAGAKWVRRDY